MIRAPGFRKRPRASASSPAMPSPAPKFHSVSVTSTSAGSGSSTRYERSLKNSTRSAKPLTSEISLARLTIGPSSIANTRAAPA